MKSRALFLCPQCELWFFREPHQRRVTCSHECHRERKREQAAQYRARDRNRAKEQQRRQCEKRKAQRKCNRLKLLATRSPLAQLNACVRQQRAMQ